MNQDLENQIFNLKMSELLSSFQENNPNKKRAFFLSEESFGIGAKVYNDQNYFYDLTSVHSIEPLGFNHPILLRSKQIPNQCHHSLVLQNSIELIQNLINKHFGLSVHFTLIKKENIQTNLDKCFYFDSSFFKSADIFQNIKDQPHNIENIIVVIDSEFVLLGINSNSSKQKYSENVSSMTSYEVEQFSRKLNFYLESNILLSDGKLSSINKKLENFAKGINEIEYKELSYQIQTADSVEASKQREKLKEQGLFVDQEDRLLKLYFPMTLLDEELDEILKILKDNYVSN